MQTDVQTIVEQAEEKASEIQKDNLHEQLNNTLKLKLPAPTDEALIGEVAEKMSRLETLEDQFTTLAQTFNCSKDQVLEKALELEGIYQLKDKAEDKLSQEKVNYRKELRAVDDEAQRLAGLFDKGVADTKKLQEKIKKLNLERKRLTAWQWLLS